MGTPAAGRITTLSIAAVAVGGLQDVRLEVSMNPIDVTDKDSAGWDEFIGGQGSLTMSGTCVYEEDDPGQEDFIDAVIAKTSASYVFRPLGANTGDDEWTVNGFITSSTIDSPNKEALGFDFSIQLTGTPTRAGQA